MADLSESLQTFVAYVNTHLKGDEKGGAADFLDHFFRALNQTCAAKEAAGEPITPPGLPLPVGGACGVCDRGLYPGVKKFSVPVASR